MSGGQDKRCRYLAVTGAIIVAIGAFLPWRGASSAPASGLFDWRGDGQITLMLAAACVVLIFLRRPVAAAGCALAIVSFALIHVVLADASMGSGWWLTALGATILLIAIPLVGWAARKELDTNRTAPNESGTR